MTAEDVEQLVLGLVGVGVKADKLTVWWMRRPRHDERRRQVIMVQVKVDEFWREERYTFAPLRRIPLEVVHLQVAQDREVDRDWVVRRTSGIERFRVAERDLLELGKVARKEEEVHADLMKVEVDEGRSVHPRGERPRHKDIASIPVVIAGPSDEELLEMTVGGSSQTSQMLRISKSFGTQTAQYLRLAERPFMAERVASRSSRASIAWVVSTLGALWARKASSALRDLLVLCPSLLPYGVTGSKSNSSSSQNSAMVKTALQRQQTAVRDARFPSL